MGLFDFLKRDTGRGIDDLANRLGMSVDELQRVQISYAEHHIPKRSGGKRRILAPAPGLKSLQRRINRRVLALLVAHTAAMGFERGKSIATNAQPHVGRAVIVRMDIRDFFPSTKADRVQKFFRAIGWNRAAAAVLTKLTTYEGSLPQGAPTSPRLSNLINFKLDVRLARLAAMLGAAYTRYADDLTFSFPHDHRDRIHALIRTAKRIIEHEGYRLHMKRKLHVRRRHQQQRITGLVVNERLNLPRTTRRRLRAIEHSLQTQRDATLTEAQLAGWRAFRKMIERTEGVWARSGLTNRRESK